MARTRLKVCCIQSVEEARMAIAAGADAIGLVSEMPSGPGVIPEELIAEIAAGVPAPVATFLLTSKTDVEGIVEQWWRCRTSVIQLVAPLVAPAQVIGGVRAAIPWVKLVPVVHVEGEGAIEEACALARCGVDGVLLDSGRPSAGVPELGGTGRVHDWAVSRRLVEVVAPVPVFLAGGLRAENVAEAVAVVRPFGVDVCSGVRVGDELNWDRLGTLVRSITGWADMGTNSRSRFRVSETFDFKSRGMLMVMGDVLAGTIRPGDLASSGQVTFPIAAVEMVNRRDRAFNVALGFRYSNEEELAQLKAFASAAELDLAPACAR